MYTDQWTVILHFGRGHTEEHRYNNKKNAQRMVDIAVFNNEDCINCSVYRTKRLVEKAASPSPVVAVASPLKD